MYYVCVTCPLSTEILHSLFLQQIGSQAPTTIQHPSKISVSQLTQSYSVILMSTACFDTTIRKRPRFVHAVVILFDRLGFYVSSLAEYQKDLFHEWKPFTECPFPLAATEQDNFHSLLFAAFNFSFSKRTKNNNILIICNGRYLGLMCSHYKRFIPSCRKESLYTVF